MAITWIDGQWYPKDEAKISVYDHGLLYGDGIFEGIRIYGGRVFKGAEHLDRLYKGARAIALEIPASPAELSSILNEGIKRDNRTEGYIRLIVTRGKGDLGINPKTCPRATIIAIFDDIQLYPPEVYQGGIPIVTAPSRRIQGEVFDPRIKSLNYLNNVLAKLEAQIAGCMEAVMLNGQGYVSECTGDNIFLVTKGVLKTPAPHLGLLEGITRNTIMELARSLRIPVEEATMTRFDLYTADEIFLSGTGAELIPVRSVDQRPLPESPGPVTKALIKAYKDHVLS